MCIITFYAFKFQHSYRKVKKILFVGLYLMIWRSFYAVYLYPNILVIY